MIRKALAHVIAILGILPFSSISQNLPVDQIQISKEDYLLNFIEINNYVSQEYTHLKNKKINLDSLSNQYITRIQTIEDKNQYITTLLQYFAQLKNSHTNLHVQPFVIDCSANLVEQILFINRVNDPAFLNAGVRKYDEIIKIDGRSALDWLQEEKKLISASTEGDRLKRAVWRVFRNEFKVPRTYEIKTASGTKVVEVLFTDLQKYQTSESNLVNSRILSDSIGYIEIKSMQGKVVEEFKKEFDRVDRLPYLIIDVRYNGGGNSNNGEQITPFLIKHKIKACVSREFLTPKSKNYKGKLFVLTGINTFSAAESFIIDLLESGDATLIGSRTAGDTGNGPHTFKTKYGMTFRIPTRKPAQVSFKGFSMEGVGIQPHINIEMTKEDYLKDIDTVLKFTVDRITKVNQSK